MADKDKTEADSWPLKETFFVEIEEHCEDGEWSGYAHSDEWPRGTEAKEAILKSAYDALAARAQKLEAALREVRPKLERVRELLKPAYTNQAYIMIEELLKDLAEQEKEG